MVEFAISFPLLLVLAISIVDYGYYLEHVNNIASVVRDGARYASENVTTSPCPGAAPVRTHLAHHGERRVELRGSRHHGGRRLGWPVHNQQRIRGRYGDHRVASTNGFSSEGDFNVTTTIGTGGGTGTGTAIIACTGTGSGTFTGCATDSYTGTAHAGERNEMEGTSDFTEG